MKRFAAIAKVSTFVPLLMQSGLFFATRIAGMLVVFTLSWVITSHFGVDTWGAYALFLAVLQPLSAIGLFGADSLLVKYIARVDIADSVKLNILNLLKICVKRNLLVILGASVTVSYIQAKYYFDFEGFQSFIYIVAVAVSTILLTWYNFNLAVIRGLKDILTYGLYQNLWPMLALLVVIGVGAKSDLLTFSLIDIIVVSVFVYSALLFLQFAYVEKRLKNGSINSATAEIKSQKNNSMQSDSHTLATNQTSAFAYKEGVSIMVIALLGMIISYADLLMLGVFENLFVVGVYDIAIKLSALSTLVLLAVNAYVMPLFSEYYSNNNVQAFRELVRKSSKIIVWLSIPLAVIGYTAAPYVLQFYGDEFLVGVATLRLLIVAQLASAMCGSVSILLQMTGNQAVFMRIFMCACTLNVLLNYIFIPLFGIIGAAAATLISTLVWNLAAAFVAFKRLGVRTIYIPGFEFMFRKYDTQ